MRTLISLLLVCSLVGCGKDVASSGGGGGDVDGGVIASGDPFGNLPTGVDQWKALCAKHYGDMISAKLCAGSSPPALTSLLDLETMLGLRAVPNPNNDPSINTNVRVTFNGESTGLGVRQVTALTPRAFLLTPPLASGGPNPQYQVMAFARGEPLVELVANDPAAHTLRFFLVRFHPACEPSCTNADLMTATIESGWTDYTIYDDDTIKDTTVDCLACHQPGGPSTPKFMRMQELANPWAHWFYPERPQTAQIVQDFQTAHGREDYAGIPYSLVMPSRPGALTTLLQNNGFGTQPNAFPTTQINSELSASGTSATWDALYAKTVAGTEIPVPYVTTATDRTKMQAAITAYQQTVAGSLPRDQMPDIRDTFLDAALPAMSITPKPGLDGRGILTHMCRMCHNSQLDQTLTRSQFNIDTLDQLPRAEKDLAIARLMMPDADAHKMPPVRFHSLSDAERDLAIQELSK
jgi:hypothetical protein